ncbi:hypothetical protein CLV40_104414 [Actinokineospora auranticolor]|uniref:Uncharacterized protein n=2 Tax=Actinokineospora auranticolor TaxID=155976 RepID=A0A2S6GVJ9_9PSEU|nr:hypothetical protein CLV40_104414 [Actinokineospora auranticolor]
MDRIAAAWAPVEERDTALEWLVEPMRAFVHEIGEPPRLGEYLDIVAWSMPGIEELEFLPTPVPLRATLVGGVDYGYRCAERVRGRVAELGDVAFAETTEWLTAMIRGLHPHSDGVLPVDIVAKGLLNALQAGEVAFADVEAKDVAALSVDLPVRVPRPRPGDVLAIPGEAGHHLAVVLATGLGDVVLGLLAGAHPTPELGDPTTQRPRRVPVRVIHDAIAEGRWPTVAHEESLLALFPDPVADYVPARLPSGQRHGEWGARVGRDQLPVLIGEAEAEAIGLLDGTHQDCYLDKHFVELLNKGRFDRGPLPGQFT